jgi:hypothetical protein
MTKVVTAHSTSLDGCIAGADDSPKQPLGVGGDRLFTWFSDGDTPSRYYPGFKMSAVSAAFFDEGSAGSARSSPGAAPTTSPRPGVGAARCPAPPCSS